MTEHLFDPAPYTYIYTYDPTSPCTDCGVATTPDDGPSEYYTVHDSVWQDAGMTPSGGMLCIGCLEGRLERRLVAEDFPDFRINWDPAYRRTDSARLRARKARTAS